MPNTETLHSCGLPANVTHRCGNARYIHCAACGLQAFIIPFLIENGAAMPCCYGGK